MAQAAVSIVTGRPLWRPCTAPGIMAQSDPQERKSMEMNPKYQAARSELLARLQEIEDLKSVAALLTWDQATYMPPGGSRARARQLATVGRLAHEKFTDKAIGHLLDQLQPYVETLPEDDDDAALWRVVRREYDRAQRIPAQFMADVANHTAAVYMAWTEARPANDFPRLRPMLEKTLALSRQYSQYFPEHEHIADPLIARSDFGMTVATIRPLFQRLRQELLPLVEQVTAQEPADDRFLHQYFPEDKQWAFGLEVIRRFGYDLHRGRQDKTHHPFMIKFSLDDVRITTRLDPHDLASGLFSTLHEAGHGLYEQGINPAYEATPLADGASAGVHESQSRLWENLVGRSRNFWHYYYPRLQETFPEQLGKVSLDAFYRAINKVERSLIRVEADELTYNLHVIIRFELELALLEGTLTIAELPEAWRASYQEQLGVTPPDDRDGVMQDVHWYAGLIGGGFQGYTLGNILTGQFYAAALAARPSLPDEIAAGDFAPLLSWLREQIHWHGSKYTALELVERVTGGPIRLEPYLDYLWQKYGELYRLSRPKVDPVPGA